MHIDLSSKEFRRLLDLVYIGNWSSFVLRAAESS